jgi:leucyl-tRNA synthetase
MTYEPKKIEPKWQQFWLENQTFRAEIDLAKPKYYALDMFPYPSGDGLHVGHPEGYTATDILSRYKRMCGFNVLHPMGWDAFGLPAEQYAIQTGTHPKETTKNNTNNFRRQIQSLGFSYDWSREIDTTDPQYMKWTQWIFKQLFERGLAYEAEVPVNWCAALGTVLANEEVIDGKSERGGHPVERVPMKQWMLKITAYAERLLADLEELDWPEAIKKQQRDWIGKSEGANVRFQVLDQDDLDIEVFTTRPDTLFGATYMVLAPEHSLVAKITSDEQRSDVDSYVKDTANKSERARQADEKTKTGVDTGARAINPVNGEEIPIWIADYVLASYGTGAIMCVPGHDVRDFEFATTFDLPIRRVVNTKKNKEADLPYTELGIATNSGSITGLATADAKRIMIGILEEKGIGSGTTTYKLRDWLFSRQRYWGEPFPLIKLEDGSVRAVADSDLPVLLPEVDDYKPRAGGNSPLQSATDWLQTTDPETGQSALRETNTMPQWAGSCWYYLRFCDPTNEEALISEEAERYWLPVDIYIGGAEHAVLHLLYSRFWHKVLYDIDVVHTKEPFHKLVNQGMILGSSYRYYDDNISDTEGASVHCYDAAQVRLEGEKSVLKADGSEVKERWVPLNQVRWEGKDAYHPDHDFLLEEVIEKMSKSRGNVINPDEVVGYYGADSLRLYEMFLGPLDKAAPWSTDGIQGVYRFLQRAYRLFFNEVPEGEDTLRQFSEGRGNEEQARLTAKTIDGVTQDIENLQFNTAISKLMVFSREIAKNAALPEEAAKAFSLLLAPFAPHLAEELWEALGHGKSLTYEPWPKADPRLLTEDLITIAVAVNGKRRDEIQIAADADEDSVRAAALALEKIQRYLDVKEPKKVIVGKGRMVNIVAP